MYYLIYYSKAVRTLQKNELAALIEQTSKSNKRRGLTGLLAYIEGKSLLHSQAQFMQVLEGDKKEVELVFNKILKDPRHSDIVLHKKGYQTKRRFNNWEVKIEQIPLSDNPDLLPFFNLDNLILQSDKFKNSDAALDFLMAFNTQPLMYHSA